MKQGPLLAFVLLAPLAALDVSLARAAISLGGVSHSGAVLLAGVTLVLLVAIAITIVVRDGSRLRVAILMAVGVGIAGGLAAGIPAARFYLDSGLLASHTLKG